MTQPRRFFGATASRFYHINSLTYQVFGRMFTRVFIKLLANYTNRLKYRINHQCFLCHKFTNKVIILSKCFTIFFTHKIFLLSTSPSFWPLTSWKLQLQVTRQSWLRILYKPLLYYVYTSSKSNKKYRKTRFRSRELSLLWIASN